jgi:hypothetical protein
MSQHKNRNLAQIISVIIVTILIGLSLSSCQSQNEQGLNIEKQQTTIFLERSGMFTLPDYAVQTVHITDSQITYTISHYNGTLTKQSVHDLSETQKETFQNLAYNLAKSNPRTKYYPPMTISDLGEGILTLPAYNREILINPYILDELPSELKELLQYIREVVVENEDAQNEN